MIRVGVIIPTRGDRPRFLENCIRMINAQRFQPTLVHIVDDPPAGDECDITRRYREGYDWFRGMRMDVLALMEDDDWYSPDYLAVMVSSWLRAGKPELFGTNYTLYYHLRLLACLNMRHTTRSSAMSTLIKPDMNFNWCQDHMPYTDSHLWFCAHHLHNGKRLAGVTFEPQRHICLGMKHGIGKTGGGSHSTDLNRYFGHRAFRDPERIFLRWVVDAESFHFYKNIS